MLESATFHEEAVSSSIRFLESLLSGYELRDFAVRFWDGSYWGNSRNPSFTLVLNHPGALRHMFSSASELSFGEAYVYGEFDLEGDWERAFGLADFLLHAEQRITQKLHTGALFLKLPDSSRPHESRSSQLHGMQHSRERDREAIAFHYSLPSDFYSLWLDKRMVYSCAYFKTGSESLDQAQEQKLDYICRKLRLHQGEQILDLGCGWGGLMSYAASRYGVTAAGITLSEPQAEFARARFRELGLTDRCKVANSDYRDFAPSEQYDKLVSVGMFEHVGEALLPDYFRRAWSLLRPGGVFLNHGIAASANYVRKGPSFIDKYVFPDGDIVPLNITLRAAETSGFEVRDVENLREHYALTLDHWRRLLEANKAEALKIVSDAVYRTWRLFMAGSAHGFRSGRLNLYQVLLSKPEHGKSGLPLTREDWY